MALRTAFRRKCVIIEDSNGGVVLTTLFNEVCDHKIGDVLNHEDYPLGRIIAEVKESDKALIDALNLVSDGKISSLINRLLNLARTRP